MRLDSGLTVRLSGLTEAEMIRFQDIETGKKSRGLEKGRVGVVEGIGRGSDLLASELEEAHGANARLAGEVQECRNQILVLEGEKNRLIGELKVAHDEIERLKKVPVLTSPNVPQEGKKVKPWEVLGISKAKYYRDKKEGA